MSIGPAIRAARGGVSRRWVQTGVVFIVVGVAAVSGVVGLTLATNSNASFKKALAKRRAPDLVVMIDASKLTSAELARTRSLKGVTQTAGPYPRPRSSSPPPPAQPPPVHRPRCH